MNASPFQQDQSLVFGHVPQTGQQSVQQEPSLKQLASNSITVHATGHIAARENAAFLANGTCAENAKYSANPESTPDRSSTGEKTNLEASVDAIMAQELKEFATVSGPFLKLTSCFSYKRQQHHQIWILFAFTDLPFTAFSLNNLVISIVQAAYYC